MLGATVALGTTLLGIGTAYAGFTTFFGLVEISDYNSHY